MEKDISGEPAPHRMAVSHAGDVVVARRTAKQIALAVGFEEEGREELAIVASEIASNLVRHAKGGILTLTPLVEARRSGIQIESLDSGPGITDVEHAVTDGVSTLDSLGDGLGTVNRLVDELDIVSPREIGYGTHLVCRKWLRGSGEAGGRVMPCPLAFGAASRAHPRFDVNGDAFVIKQWNTSTLTAVIDGVGHGQFAHRASQAARQYVQGHFDQPLEAIFRGTTRACRATRGVVMTLARFDWRQARLTFAGIGNVEAQVFGSPAPMNLIIRRGILGLNASNPMVTEHRWDPDYLMILYSDGLKTPRRWDEIAPLADQSATVMAQKLLRRLARDDDDATVMVVKGARDNPGVRR